MVEEVRMAIVEGRGMLSFDSKVEEREDVGLGAAGLFHLLNSDRLEVMDRQNSSRPEVVQTRRVREQDKVPDGGSRNTTRHSLKSQVTNCFFISTYIMPEHFAGVDYIKQ